MTLAWDANFYPGPGLGASLVALRGSLSVRLLHMDTVRSASAKRSFVLQTRVELTDGDEQDAN